jgi:hypothetical protein
MKRADQAHLDRLSFRSRRRSAVSTMIIAYHIANEIGQS